MAAQAPSYSLSLTDRVSDWPCVLETKREEVATVLVTLVGQGRAEMDEHFFEQCIAGLALEPNVYDLQIRDAANGCAYLSTLVFGESD